MKHTDVVIIGGGQAGLAMSRCLTGRGVDHVVLERGRLAERWRSERWDSLRLLTPRWQSRLPGWSYRGPDPHGYMSMGEVVSYFERYAESFSAPLEAETSVQSVRAVNGGYRVATDRGAWRARNVVIATGACDRPAVPAFAAGLSSDVNQLAPSGYRNPDQLPPEQGVLVVGASASGAQLAEEIHASGRPVTLAVGKHTRIPRCHRGVDIMWWLDRMGIFDARIEDVRDIAASRRQPSFQLVGVEGCHVLDLGSLQQRGVRLVGRALAADGHRVRFADDLGMTTAAADAKLDRLLGRLEDWASQRGLDTAFPAPVPPPPVRASSATTEIDLRQAGIGTVVWATGYRRTYPWLEVPVVDARGELVHRGGVTPAPGLYALGLQFMRRRKSTFIDGVGDDASDLADHIVGRLARQTNAA